MAAFLEKTFLLLFLALFIGGKESGNRDFESGDMKSEGKVNLGTVIQRMTTGLCLHFLLKARGALRWK